MYCQICIAVLMDLGNAGKQPNRADGGLICNKMIYAVGLMEE